MPVARIRAVISGISGLPGLYTAYFGTSATPATTAEANDMNARVRACWQQLRPDLAAGTLVDVATEVDTLDIASGALLGRTAVTTPAAQVVASGTGELPPFTMGGLKLLTALVVNGRVVQGRSFIGPLATASSASGVPSSGFRTDMVAAGALLGTGATAVANVVWHRPNAAHTGGAVGPVTGYTSDTKLWVLRSRRD